MVAASLVRQDGLYCSGMETCNETMNASVSGSPPACVDDGKNFCNRIVSCCNESTNEC
jgi:hypothetical protein